MADNPYEIDISKIQIFNEKFKLLDGYTNKITIKNADSYADFEQMNFSISGDNAVITIYDSPTKTRQIGKITLTNGKNLKSADSFVYLNDVSINSGYNLFFSPTKKGNSYSGTWVNEQVQSTSANEKYNLGTGSDSIIYNFSQGAQGKDTITFNKNEKLNLSFRETSNLSVSHRKAGNDIIASITTPPDNSVDSYKVTYKITKSGMDYKYTYTFYAVQNDGTYSAIGTSYTGKINVLMYLYAKDYFAEKSFSLNENKLHTIFLKTKKGFNPEDINYAIKNDVDSLSAIIKNNIKYASKIDPYDYGQLTLKNYFKIGAQLVTKDGLNNFPITTDCDGEADILSMDAIVATLNATYNRQGETKKQTITDTFLNEELFGGSNKDTIKSTGGNDKITGGKGDDNITAKNGIKTLYFNSGDGFDTITADKTADLVLNLDEDISIPGVYYSRKGNNLIINRKSDIIVNENPSPDLTDSITIKNYFSVKPKVTINYTQTGNDYTSSIELNPNTIILTQFGSDIKNNTLSGTISNDVIYAGKKTTKINTGDGINTIWQSIDGSNLTVNSGKGNDTYFIRDFNKTISITDKSGTDEIICSGVSGSDIHYLFDISKNGKINSTELKIIGSGDSLADIVSDAKQNNKGKLPISIKINNFFKKNSEGDTGSGYIENIDLNGREYDFNEVRENVASWLRENNYASVNQFISKGAGDNELTQQLFEIFDNGFKENYMT